MREKFIVKSVKRHRIKNRRDLNSKKSYNSRSILRVSMVMVIFVKSIVVGTIKQKKLFLLISFVLKTKLRLNNRNFSNSTNLPTAPKAVRALKTKHFQKCQMILDIRNRTF